MLTFAFQTNANRFYYLDDIFVTHRNSPSVGLLQNSNFGNSTTSITGWILSCNSTCNGSGARIVNGSACTVSYGYCLRVNCYGNQSVVFLSQSFSSITNESYRISFWLRTEGNGTSAETKFNVTLT